MLMQHSMLLASVAPYAFVPFLMRVDTVLVWVARTTWDVDAIYMQLFCPFYDRR
jgi:hypothetical protein